MQPKKSKIFLFTAILSRSRIAVFFFFLFIVSACGRDYKNTTKVILNESFSELMPALMKELQARISTKGVKEAVSMCSEQAIPLTQQKEKELFEKYKSKYGIKNLEIKRISLKNRNAKNTPDPIEEKVLKSWTASKVEPVVMQEGKTYYGLTPIRIIQPLCLSCHGKETEIDPQVLSEIKKRYPADKATGYILNELRGAFSVKIQYN